VGDKIGEARAQQAGRVLWMSTESIVQVAREAGAPKEKGAGVILKQSLATR